MDAAQIKPVRRIGVSHRAVVGALPGRLQYESTLERDLMELVRFDKNVELYTPQPLTVRFRDAAGKARSYTPDGFIEFRRDVLPAAEMPHVLCEVKFRKDFREKWREYLPKYRAAKKYCVQHGWEFRVFTEREIRTPYLQNVRFLWPYRQQVPNADLAMLLLDKIEDLRETDAEALLVALYRDKWNRAAALPALWQLVADFQVGCELAVPLTMRSKLWTLRG